VNTDTHQQDRSEIEKAALKSFYEDEMLKLINEMGSTKELLDEARRNNVEMRKELTEQHAKLSKLQKMMVRAGRKDDAPVDGEISAQFAQLRSDILQMVKSHLIFVAKPAPGASPELGELHLRRVVARALHAKFFSRDAMPFGFEDEKLGSSPMRRVENLLRITRCDGMFLTSLHSLVANQVHYK
jgi:hypothetical protein